MVSVSFEGTSALPQAKSEQLERLGNTYLRWIIGDVRVNTHLYPFCRGACLRIFGLALEMPCSFSHSIFSMALISDLPAELLLQIFSRLVLKSIINARCVCQLWRSTMLEADIHPTRRHLLRLYNELLDTELFIRSRSHFLENMLSFNRQDYLDRLLSQMVATGIPPVLPVTFEIFILEWPAAAAFDSIWPGIPYEWTKKDGDFRRRGWNYLNHIPPQLFELRVIDCGVDYVTHNVAALPILQAGDAGVSYWMIMDSRNCLFGRALFVTTTSPSYQIPEPYDPSVHSEMSAEKWERKRESTQLSFCDWLDVSMDRWKMKVDEIYYGEVEYDEELKRWKDDTYREDNFDGVYWPVPPEGLGSPLVILGGNMTDFKPITPLVAPLVRVYPCTSYVSRC